MSVVSYDGQGIIPGPMLTIQREYARSEDGKARRKFFSLALHGKFSAWKGSPNSKGVFWTQSGYPPDEVISADSRLTSILNKQAALMALFVNSGRTLQVQPFDGAPPLKCYPRVQKVEFPEGHWTDTCDFTVQMEADEVWVGGTPMGGGLDGVEAEESWAIEIENPNTRTYRVSHTVSSQQRATYDETGTIVAEGWQNAKSLVDPLLGSPLPGDLTPPNLGPYFASNYTRSETVDEANGRYSVTENFVYVFGQKFTEEFVVQCRLQEGQSHVTVEGTVTGFSDPDPTLTPAQWQAERYAQALAAWDDVQPELLTRAQNYSGLPLNPVVLNQTVGHNPVGGVVTYNVEYDNRPPSMVQGSLSETLTVQNRNPRDIFAALVVLGRIGGPVLQSIGTVSEKVRTVALEVVMPPWVYGKSQPAAPNVLPVLVTYFPAGGFVSQDDDSWVPRTGRYSRTVAWTYE